MNKEELKKIKRIRYKLREKITNNINKGLKDNITKDMVIEYHRLTKILEEGGMKVSIKLDYLQLEYWNDLKKDIVKIIKKPKKEIPKESLQKNNKYIISLAWTESEKYNINDTISIIKNYFEDLNIKEESYETFMRNNDIEHILRYEYVGEEESFKILKYSAQYLLDTISKNDYEKFNIAIFGKQKEI